MTKYHLLSLVIALAGIHISLHAPAQEYIALHPQNPHYFSYKNKPIILITSGEHYGAVLNLDFDYHTYLDELERHGLNLTRTFTGAYAEPEGAFNISRNTLAPGPGRYICPWARSAQSGYPNGGNKFDLSRWDEAYFTRLRDFVRSARDKGVIVELALFCPFYKEDQWSLSPMNAVNNINGIGAIARDSVYTLDRNDGLLEIQEKLVRKIVTELKDFGNVIYEICNEPYFGGVMMDWQHHIADVIRSTEDSVSVRHLISQNIANGSLRIADPHPGVSVFNFHYASPPVAVAQNYYLNKVIGDNETGFRGNSDSTYRMEAWAFIMAGGGLFNNLDYSFAPGHEDGTFTYPPTQPGGGSPALRKQLKYLSDFINRFNFIRMQPDTTVVEGELQPMVRIHVLAERGRQYAAYVFGTLQSELRMLLPPGNYVYQFLDPSSGLYSDKAVLNHKGGKANIPLPNYEYELVIRIVAQDLDSQQR